MTLSILLLLASCGGKRNKSNLEESLVLPTEEGYSIIFFHLDNYALLYLDDSLIVDTRDRSKEIEEDILINLQQYLTRPKHQLKIEGYNASCGWCSVNAWDIGYEFYLDGDEINYESLNSNREHEEPGLKFTKEYTLIND